MRKSLLLVAIAVAVISCSTTENQTLSVVPYPNEVNILNGTFNAAGADVRFAAELDEASCNAIKSFADQLSMVTGQENAINGTDAPSSFKDRKSVV